jgi:hypothetical protein
MARVVAVLAEVVEIKNERPVAAPVINRTKWGVCATDNCPACQPALLLVSVDAVTPVILPTIFPVAAAGISIGKEKADVVLVDPEPAAICTVMLPTGVELELAALDRPSETSSRIAPATNQQRSLSLDAIIASG